MRIIHVDERFSAGTQPETDADWDAIAAGGFRSVVNNRRYGEDGAQPSAAAERAAASRRGLGYAHVPVAPGAIGDAEVDAFARALAAAEGPVFAHCKSGLRSLLLWTVAAVRTGRLRADEIPSLGARLGDDLAAAAPLASRGGALPPGD